jgi:hypothetical protein
MHFTHVAESKQNEKSFFPLSFFGILFLINYLIPQTWIPSPNERSGVAGARPLKHLGKGTQKWEATLWTPLHLSLMDKHTEDHLITDVSLVQ